MFKFIVVIYMFLGHNLDLAASSIDNQVGQLNGYLTIVFDGDNNSRENNEENLTVTFDKNENLCDATIENVSQYYEQKDSVICKLNCCDSSIYKDGKIYVQNISSMYLALYLYNVNQIYSFF